MGDNEGNGRRRRLFLKDGRPARFFLHQSIRRESQRQKLRVDIEAYGGRVASTDDHVDTVLISDLYDRELLRVRYGVDKDKRKRAIHVERLSFVQHCIRQKRFVHRIPIVKGMGGRPGRRTAVPFSVSDDENICEYIARLQPRKEAGGRSGNQMYKQLMVLAEEFPEYFAWVKRHTFHAWRERYKKKKHIFDPQIEEIAKAEGTYDKPVWLEDRNMSRRRLRTRRHLEDEDDPEEEENEEEEEEEGEEEIEVEEEDRIREEQEGEEDELAPQPEDGYGGEYGQEIRVPQDGNLEEQQVQDMDIDLSKTKKRTRRPSAIPDQVAKKRRFNISPSYPVRSKGKEIAYESDQGSDGNYELANTVDRDEEVPLGDFENDEPGPSNVLRSSDRSRVDASRSNKQQMSLTQETLVNTQSRMEFEPVSHSTSANRHHSGPTPRSQLEIRATGEQEQESPPRPVPRPPPVRRVTPGTSRGGQEGLPNPTETSPASRPELRSKQRAIVQPSDAPYRNTRARSRSVEPVAMPPPTYKATRRRKQNREAAEREVRNEPIAPSRITETIEEEMDVEHILVANMGGTAVRARGPSLETDDAQTRRDLRPASTRSSTFLSEKMTAVDALRKFESSSSSRRYSPILQQRPPTLNDSALSENRRRSEHLITSKLPDPRTPVNLPRTREQSSSVEPFPLEGTRASAAKKERREKEKHTPYKPFEGTRAAQFAKSR